MTSLIELSRRVAQRIQFDVPDELDLEERIELQNIVRDLPLDATEEDLPERWREWLNQ